MEPWAAPRKKKKLYASEALSPAPLRVLVNGHLPRESRQSRLSEGDTGDNEVKPGLCTVSWNLPYG